MTKTHEDDCAMCEARGNDYVYNVYGAWVCRCRSCPKNPRNKNKEEQS